MEPNNHLDLLSIGDASLDVFITPSESETSCRLDTKESLVCFDYGEKIPVKALTFSIGGNAANNAVGTRRLGIKSAAVLTLGTDKIAEQIIEVLQWEGVDITYILQQPATTSNYSSIINYGGERTILTYKYPRSYEFPVKLPSVPWVYLTSMGEAFSPFYKHLIDWLKKQDHQGVKLAFNPGSRQVRAGVDSLREILSFCEIIYVNRKEAEKLTGMSETQGKEKELLKALAGLGPKIPIITDGAEGSLIFNGQRFLKAGILPVDAFERTGAGDSFGAGCIAALIKGRPLEEALLWGTVNSASVIGYVGSQKGLLREKEMPVWLERAKTCEVKVEEF